MLVLLASLGPAVLCSSGCKICNQVNSVLWMGAQAKLARINAKWRPPLNGWSSEIQCEGSHPGPYLFTPGDYGSIQLTRHMEAGRKAHRPHRVHLLLHTLEELGRMFRQPREGRLLNRAIYAGRLRFYFLLFLSRGKRWWWCRDATSSLVSAFKELIV